MTTPEQPRFATWEERYQTQPVESLPWFNPELDADIAAALVTTGLQGGAALDLGTGPGTQAIQLARRGFRVTATDISTTALALAQARAEAEGVDVRWVQDDILSTHLQEQYTLIVDRGCFHVLAPEQRSTYVDVVARLLVRQGYYFLKCFSHLQPGTEGPARFTPAQIRELFGGLFAIQSIVETIYHGTLVPPPRALFCAMRRLG
jgi:cyclopropane fatty-acyl-phospholipid synthase-like methyltransferase